MTDSNDIQGGWRSGRSATANLARTEGNGVWTVIRAGCQESGCAGGEGGCDRGKKQRGTTLMHPIHRIIPDKAGEIMVK